MAGEALPDTRESPQCLQNNPDKYTVYSTQIVCLLWKFSTDTSLYLHAPAPKPLPCRKWGAALAYNSVNLVNVEGKIKTHILF